MQPLPEALQRSADVARVGRRQQTIACQPLSQVPLQVRVQLPEPELTSEHPGDADERRGVLAAQRPG